jgi:hypothetical protein
MNKKSFFYKHPSIYINGLKLIHKINFDKRYKYMAGFADKGNSVLEPACGPSILADYLPAGTSYRGFDTNKDFIDYAAKKGFDVNLGNVLDRKNYSPSDCVIACDILHHLKPEDRKTFIDNCYNFSKKAFILCEPGKKEGYDKGVFSFIGNMLGEWSESDGTIDFKTEYFVTRNKLLEDVKNGFGVIPNDVKRTTKDFGEDIVTVFYAK